MVTYDDKQFNRNLISSEDFIEAKEYLNAIDDELDAVIRKALFVAAIVSYCRPFTANHGKESAEPSISEKFVNELRSEQRTLHDRLMELRHTVIAHSDFDSKPCTRVSGGVALMKPAAQLNKDIDIDLFLKLIDGMAYRCSKKNLDMDGENPL